MNYVENPSGGGSGGGGGGGGEVVGDVVRANE